MGWDIAPIGLKHKVDTSSMESVAMFLVKHFNANINCRTVNKGWDKDSTIPITSDCGSYVCEGSTRNIELIENRNGYMGCRDHWEIQFGWNPFPCFCEDEYVDIILYEDLVNLEMVERPFRWFWFLSNFVEHEADEESDTICREALDRFRESVREYARVFGCEKVMYIADQGVDDYILYQCEKLDSDSLMEYVSSLRFLHECRDYERDRSIFLDVPSFLSEKQDLIRQGRDIGYLDVLFDDFRDISGI